MTYLLDFQASGWATLLTVGRDEEEDFLIQSLTVCSQCLPVTTLQRRTTQSKMLHFLVSGVVK